MAGITAWVLGDQLSLANPALDGADRVLLIESRAALSAKRFHRQKLHLILVAMRTFAEELRAQGREVELLSAPTLRAGLAEHVERHHPDEIRLMEPKAARGRERLAALERVTLVPDCLFLTRPEAFADWARGRKRLTMEDFYRHQRRRLDVLMDGERPAEGRWNLDAENRHGARGAPTPPAPLAVTEGPIDAEVRADLDAADLASFGEDGPRRWPASHAEAEAVLEEFIATRLERFGTFQDAMVPGERTMWHSLISSSLNLGLLDPLRCVRAAEAAYVEGREPLNSVEGFIRQIIGWREYVWCMYWWTYAGREPANALEANGPLPAVLETGDTQMACLSDAVSGLRETAYSHHIERLMLYGNLVLLAGTDPRAALDWFHRAFIDGYDWVMAPNVLGMATWSDGGQMMTKPYAASGRYVERMSDYCKGCVYAPGERVGATACPFTTLYWDFLDRHRDRLASNRRMAMPLRNLGRIDDAQLREIRAQAARLRTHFDA